MPPSEKRCWSVIFPIFTTRDLDLAGLKFIWVQLMRHSRPYRIHLQPGTDVEVIVRSSINALIGCCYIPEFVNGPLHSTSADFTSIFMETSVTEIVHPGIMTFSS